MVYQIECFLIIEKYSSYCSAISICSLYLANCERCVIKPGWSRTWEPRHTDSGRFGLSLFTGKLWKMTSFFISFGSVITVKSRAWHFKSITEGEFTAEKKYISVASYIWDLCQFHWTKWRHEQTARLLRIRSIWIWRWISCVSNALQKLKLTRKSTPVLLAVFSFYWWIKKYWISGETFSFNLKRRPFNKEWRLLWSCVLISLCAAFKVPITLTQFLSFSKVDVESKPKQAK